MDGRRLFPHAMRRGLQDILAKISFSRESTESSARECWSCLHIELCDAGFPCRFQRFVRLRCTENDEVQRRHDSRRLLRTREENGVLDDSLAGQWHLAEPTNDFPRNAAVSLGGGSFNSNFEHRLKTAAETADQLASQSDAWFRATTTFEAYLLDHSYLARIESAV